MARVKQEYRYYGSEPQPAKAKVSHAPMSSLNAQGVALCALEHGTERISQHFKERAMERGFSTIDAENVIRDGRPKGGPEYCPDFGNYKYHFIGKVDDQTLEVVVALDPSRDFEKSPAVILLTGYWHKSTRIRTR